MKQLKNWLRLMCVKLNSCVLFLYFKSIFVRDWLICLGMTFDTYYLKESDRKNVRCLLLTSLIPWILGWMAASFNLQFLFVLNRLCFTPLSKQTALHHTLGRYLLENTHCALTNSFSGQSPKSNFRTIVNYRLNDVDILHNKRKLLIKWCRHSSEQKETTDQMMPTFFIHCSQ